tara:strand:- start:1337 stop:2542 length:1206 start_codon:yes stop_codon:yes gene_type:complete
MALNMTTFAAALKQHYTSQKIENMVYKDNPFLAMISKYESFGGENLKLPIKYGIPQGRSADFAKALANKTNTQLKAFLLTRKSNYSLANIDNETIEASKGNANAFIEAATTEIDGAIESATRSLAISLFGDGGGSVGTIGGTAATGTTLTLAQPDDVTNFEVGMKIDFYTAATGGTKRAGGPLTVDAVDRDAGTMTLSASMTGITGIALGDFIVPEGDYDAMLSGLAAWVPSTAPGSTDSFFGVNRSADATRLGGIRFDGTALPLEEALIGAASRAAREGGKPNVCFMNYSNFADLEKALGSKLQYIDVKVTTDIGFRGIQINGPRGTIQVIPDQNCPKDVAFMLDMSMWKLYSLGKAPKILDPDGLRFLRISTEDAVEVRVGYYAQLGCRGPGFNVRIAL